MNKKFSTLMMMGMLIAGSSFVSAQDAVMLNGKPLKLIDYKAAKDNVSRGGKVIILRDLGTVGVIDVNDIALLATKNQKGDITYSTKALNAADWDNEDEAAAIWNVTETIDGITSAKKYYYSFQSANTGEFLTVETKDGKHSILTEAGQSYTAATYHDKGKGTFFATSDDTQARFNQGDKLYYQPSSSINNSFVIGTSVPGVGGTATPLLFATVEDRVIDVVDELNDQKGGKGFQFTFPDGETVIDNIFKDLDLRAFRVKAQIPGVNGADSIGWEDQSGNYFEIPAGIYLATGDSWKELAKTEEGKAILEDNIIDNAAEKELFQKMTFLAIDPQDFTTITNTKREDGKGFTLTTVKGSDMNYYDAETAKNNEKYNANMDSKKDEVFVGNACFTITEINPLSKNDEYSLSVANARLDKKGDDKHEYFKKVTIGKIPNTNNDNVDTTEEFVYLVTNGNAVKVKAVPSTTIADVKELLNNDATPAIYAIKFVSGAEEAANEEVSEYGQYLTLESNGSFTFAAMPSVNDGANENDPLYQFVVTGVADNDDDDNYETVKITNRLTKASVSVVLYDEEELGENVYTIYPSLPDGLTRDQKLQVAYTENGKLVLKDKEIRGMQVELIKKENVDKFATFETAQSEQGLFTFEFAKTAEADDRLYAAVPRDKKTGEYDFTKAANGVVTSKTADQFELIRVKKTAAPKEDKVSYILNDFIYIANGRVVTAQTKKDTVAFYSYNIRLFAPDETDEYYLNTGNLSKTEAEHIIKYNVDGSVSVFATTTPANNFQSPRSQNVLLVSSELQSGEVAEDENVDVRAWVYGYYYDYQVMANMPVKTFLVAEKVYGTLNPVPQETEFNEKNGFGALYMNEDKNGILNPFDKMTFRLDTVDTDTNVPSFYISKKVDNARHFLYFAKDSADSKRVTNWQKYTFANGNDKYQTRLIFKAAAGINSDTLQTVVDGKQTKVAEKANKVTGVVGGLNNFKFQVIESGDEDGTYVIRNKTNGYLIQINNQLTLGSDIEGATRFLVDPDETVANEEISASEISVVAGNGVVTVKGAAGKNVAISNVLGQTIANIVVSSDEATISAPAGVVVVAVEGEAAVKAIVK